VLYRKKELVEREKAGRGEPEVRGSKVQHKIQRDSSGREGT